MDHTGELVQQCLQETVVDLIATGLASAAIREARLAQIASDLVDERLSTQSITDIAMRWGINNLQHFSQIFKKRYGQPPSEYRRCTIAK